MTDQSTLATTPTGADASDLRPDDVARRRFSTSFRGYDTEEVRSFLTRVAARQRTLVDKLAGVTAELEAARTVVPAPMIDLTGAVERAEPGADALVADRLAADVLMEDARQEAALILARANDEAARIQLRARAESRGKAEGSRAVPGAAEGSEEVDVSKVQAKAMIAEARAVRERILTDLNKRRRTAHIQLEQLRAAREKLQETMREARRVIDASSRDLTHAEVEARLAAEAAGRRVSAEPLPTVEELEAELSGGRHFGPAARSRPDVDQLPDDTGTDDAESITLLVLDGEPVDAGDLTETENEPVLVVDSVAVEVAVEEVVDEVVGAVVVDEVVMDEVVIVVVDEVVIEPVAEDELTQAEAPADDAMEPSTAQALTPPRKRKVDDLFAKLRAEREASSQRARDVLGTSGPSSRGSVALATDSVPDSAVVATGSAVAPPAVSAPEPERDRSEPVREVATADSAPSAEPGPSRRSPDDDAVLAMRERSLELVRVRTSKQLKRQLQDEHGAALATLRRARGQVTVDELMGLEVDQRGRCVALMLPAILEAAACGQRLVSESEEQIATLVVRCAEIAEEVAADLSSPVRDSVGDAIEDQEVDLASVLGHAYREWTSDRLAERVREALSAGFAAGAFFATDAATPVRWILDDGDEPCSDCDDNVLSGAQASGEAFPTGELYPPVHQGCRCLVVPVGPLVGLGD